ncbi:MAG: Ig-like domain-containing protein [Coriobacteriales bacterium]|nr:Ig-like domain-containing protein [Coriobacteriales bacterium]
MDVTGVSLNKTETTINVGDAETLTATVSPADTTAKGADQTVAWSSSDTGVATVENGVVTGVAPGTATITCTATNGTETAEDDKTATCEVTVSAPKHAVAARVVPEGAGTVALGAPQVAEGETAGIEATPAEGYEFERWTVDGAGAKIDDATSPKATLTMGTADVSVTATFRKKAEPEPTPAEVPPVSVTAHVQRKGTLPAASGGAIAGTTGKSLRMESIKLTVDGASETGGIEYRGHVQRKGWERSWARDGAMAGTEGKSRRMEAVQIRLWGDMAEKYDVYYRVHSQRYGWMAWAKNGDKAGTQGMSRRAEAIQVVLVAKDAPAPATDFQGATQAYAKAFAKK